MNLNLKLGIVIGLLIGIAVCGVPSPKPVLTSRIEPTGIQVPLKPTWIPLAVASTDSATQSPTISIPIELGPTPELSAPLVSTSGSSSHSDLLSAAGIDSSQHAAAEQLVQRESSWNPMAYNAEGACSLVQSLPCSKISGDWTDPVTALTWGDSYVKSRYGSWDAALAHSLAFNYY